MSAAQNLEYVTKQLVNVCANPDMEVTDVTLVLWAITVILIVNRVIAVKSDHMVQLVVLLGSVRVLRIMLEELVINVVQDILATQSVNVSNKGVYVKSLTAYIHTYWLDKQWCIKGMHRGKCPVFSDNTNQRKITINMHNALLNFSFF